ncbi:unnamed protein product [Calypogeia fissa]
MGGSQALLSYRSFSEGRDKYCYEVPTTSVTTYLIRASFYMNAYELRDKQPFQFIVSVNATNWFTISSGDVENEYDLLIVQEGLFYSPTQVMYICLQPVVGVPFISSLELRQLVIPMYPDISTGRQYLPLLFRYNLGAVLPTPSVRFPDDLFDRIWQTLDAEYDTLPSISRLRAPDNISGIRTDVNFVPPKVMQDAWLFPSPNDTVTFPLYPLDTTYSYKDQVTLNTAKEYVYAVVYAEDLNTSASAIPFFMNIALDSYPSGAVNFSHQASMQVIPYFILSSDSISFSVSAPPGARTAPSINAVELYAQFNFNFSTTTITDVVGITALKTIFALADWQGDPCSPKPHNWLACYGNPQQGFGLGTIYSVTSINISHVKSSGFSSLSNNLTAPSQFKLQTLEQMIITNGGIDSRTFVFILNNFCPDLLSNLDLSYNAIDTIPPETIWPQLQSLNLYQNLLSADILNAFQNISTLNILNLSYNSISSPPTQWTWASTLNVLDLSHNQLQSDILSSLDQLLSNQVAGLAGLAFSIVTTLMELYVSDNHLSGKFPTSLLNRLGVV